MTRQQAGSATNKAQANSEIPDAAWRESRASAGEVANFLGISARSVWRELERNPEFPQPIRIGQRKPRSSDGRIDSQYVRWRWGDVIDYATEQNEKAKAAS